VGAPGYPAHAPCWGSAVQAQAAGRSRIGAVAADCSTSAPTAPAHCRVRSQVGARARPPPAGLAAQPVPGRPRRSRARLRAGRGARQREYRRGRAGHHLAVAAQGLHPPRARHARRQLRSRPATGHRRCPPAQPASRPPRPWIRCSRPSTPASSPPVHGHRLSCMSGSAVTSSTPSWAPTWSSSYTARATPASPPPGSGDHLAG
jgi:hypothetical protein